MWEVNELTTEETEMMAQDKLHSRSDEINLQVDLANCSDIRVTIEIFTGKNAFFDLVPGLFFPGKKTTIVRSGKKYKKYPYTNKVETVFWDKTTAQEGTNQWVKYTVALHPNTHRILVNRRLRRRIPLLRSLSKNNDFADKAKMVIGVVAYLYELSMNETGASLKDMAEHLLGKKPSYTAAGIIEYQELLDRVIDQPCFPFAAVLPDYPVKNEKAEKVMEMFNDAFNNAQEALNSTNDILTL